jgi:drug/metabolite transporter (DMT)-like permease
MTNTPIKSANRTLGFLACALASTFWGCGFYFGKIALAQMNVGAMVLYRFAFATLGLLPLLLTHRPRFTAAEWRTLALASLLGVPMLYLVEFRGLALTTVSHGSLMIGLTPIVIALGAVIFTHERLPAIGWIALVTSTVGAALIALAGSHRPTAQGPSLGGDVIIGASTVLALFWILLNKRLMESHNPITVTVWGILLGTLMLAIWVPLTWGLPPIHGVSRAAWLALIASGLLCTTTTTLLWNFGLTQVPASQAGILLNMEPLIGSLLGIYLLHEHLGLLAWLGGALILGGAIVITTRRPRPQPVAPRLAQT